MSGSSSSTQWMATALLCDLPALQSEPPHGHRIKIKGWWAMTSLGGLWRPWGESLPGS